MLFIVQMKKLFFIIFAIEYVPLELLNSSSDESIRAHIYMRSKRYGNMKCICVRDWQNGGTMFLRKIVFGFCFDVSHVTVPQPKQESVAKLSASIANW